MSTRRSWIALLALSLSANTGCANEPDDPRRAARERLLREIEDDARFTATLTGRAQIDPRVLAALDRVPRERFVPADDLAAVHRCIDERSG
jgi:hypothetical protein